jgi:hypothetical protein
VPKAKSRQDDEKPSPPSCLTSFIGHSSIVVIADGSNRDSILFLRDLLAMMNREKGHVEGRAEILEDLT